MKKRFLCFCLLASLMTALLCGCVEKTSPRALSAPETQPAEAETAATDDDAAALRTPEDLYALLKLSEEDIAYVERLVGSFHAKSAASWDVLCDPDLLKTADPALIDALRAVGFSQVGNLTYLVNRAVGLAEPLTERLDEETVRNIVHRYESRTDGKAFSEIYNAITAIQPYPDVVAGSGITRYEYWFNDEGTAGIFLRGCENPEAGGSVTLFTRPKLVNCDAEKMKVQKIY